MHETIGPEGTPQGQPSAAASLVYRQPGLRTVDRTKLVHACRALNKCLQQHVLQADPTNEEYAAFLFMGYVRKKDYKKQQMVCLPCPAGSQLSLLHGISRITRGSSSVRAWPDPLLCLLLDAAHSGPLPPPSLSLFLP